MRASSEPVEADAAGREVPDFFRECREQTDARLDVLVPAEDVEPALVHKAIRWSLFAGGKRLRPALLLASGRAFGASDASLLTVACALEMIHTYSLIHDDLPAMDDDSLRRGRPTCHIRFDEATAILAGDALQTLAFQAIALEERLSAEVRVRIISEVARASGTPAGMIAGQAYDLAAESREVTGEQLERIHQHKTGALIVASVRCGALVAGADDRELEAVTRYGASLGLLFQITDDLLDVTATVEDLGKTPGKDERARKATYPALYGIEASRMRARAVHAQACAALESIERPAALAPLRLLRGIADTILERRA
ncbi:MAG TPA: farnesyl diphosphate synthase [Pyrinomonadaceae bacterium]|jgi:geranylgeranyl pyrophosphate synthase|nr:farnesyl diphosphate synthase [Pyrinomonadaceae bacterium]